MTSDPRAALDRLIAALEAHLAAASRRQGEADPDVVDAYQRLADAFELYDEALYDAYDEVTPFVLYDDAEDAADDAGAEDDEDADDEDDLADDEDELDDQVIVDDDDLDDDLDDEDDDEDEDFDEDDPDDDLDLESDPRADGAGLPTGHSR